MITSADIKAAHISLQGQPLQVSLQEQDPSTLALLGHRSTLTIPDTDQPYTSDNAIAYRPNFDADDPYNSSLAVLFINLEVAFPCLRNNIAAPACSLFSLEEDGFFGGRPLLQIADIGNHLFIFSNRLYVSTFGFGFAGCSTFAESCVPIDPALSYELSLVCLLPRSVCT